MFQKALRKGPAKDPLVLSMKSVPVWWLQEELQLLPLFERPVCKVHVTHVCIADLLLLALLQAWLSRMLCQSLYCFGQRHFLFIWQQGFLRINQCPNVGLDFSGMILVKQAFQDFCLEPQTTLRVVSLSSKSLMSSMLACSGKTSASAGHLEERTLTYIQIYTVPAEESQQFT